MQNFNLAQQRYDLLRFIPLDPHDRSSSSSEFFLSPAGKNASQVNLSSRILRRELVVLAVLAGIKGPYHASPEAKKSFWLISTRGVVLNLLGGGWEDRGVRFLLGAIRIRKHADHGNNDCVPF
jgi:hypothetical protein